MKQSTLLFFTSLAMVATGILFLWGHWEILAGIFFLMWGNNLMNKGVAKQNEERRYSWWRNEYEEYQVPSDKLKAKLNEIWEKNKDA